MNGMKLAGLAALESKDPSSQIGAAVVAVSGAWFLGRNHLLPGGTWNKPEKYDWVIHAEEDAVLQCLRAGQVPHTLYCTWGICKSCAKLIAQSGVKRVIRQRHEHPDWIGSIQTGERILDYSGVELIESGLVLGIEVRIAGKPVKI